MSFKQTVLFFSIATFLGCAGSHTKPTTGPVADLTLQEKLDLIAAPSEVVFEGKVRVPASAGKLLSTMEQQWLEIYQLPYKTIVPALLARAKDPQDKESHKILGRYLDQMSRVYYRTDMKIREFDLALKKQTTSLGNNGPTILEQPIYKEQLLPLWIIQDRIQRQISHVLVNLLLIENDSTSNPEDAKNARRILDYTRQIWTNIADDNATGEHKANNRVLRFVLQDLVRDTSSSITAFFDRYTKRTGRPAQENMQQFVALAKRIVVSDPKQLASLQTQLQASVSLEESKEKALVHGEEKSGKVSWISLVHSAAKDSLVVDNGTSRTPQASRICPSATEGSGNISGGSFPKGTWVLSMDDGPHAKHTPRIRAAIVENSMTGTYFWLAKLVEGASVQSSVQGASMEGSTIANHSYSHANLPTLGPDGLKKEIETSTEILTAKYGFKPKYFRCPYGACGKSGGSIRTKIADLDLVHVAWNVDSLDWKDKVPSVVFERTKQQIKAIDAKGTGGIILFHDIHETSAATIELLTAWMKEQNFNVRSLGEVVAEVNAGQECPTGWTP